MEWGESMFPMRRCPSQSQLSIIFLAIWLLIFPAYLHYACLDDVDIAASIPVLKNTDEEAGIDSTHKRENLFGPVSAIQRDPHLEFFVRPALSLPSSVFLQTSRTPILRC